MSNRDPLKLRTTLVLASLVFAVSVAVRIPSCFQSFWVDELHSAWCIWDSLAEVTPRATAGNQSPFYFYGLWFWKQCFGDSEWALRMTSVLATSGASAMLLVGVSRHWNSHIAGVASGLVLALETNAIFFGTELRPYAWVILASTIATLAFLNHCAAHPTELRYQLSGDPARRSWIILAVASLTAVILHPTAAGVLAWCFIALTIKRFMRGRSTKGSGLFVGLRWRVPWTEGLLGLATLILGWALWSLTVRHTWQIRSDWATFAHAPSLKHAIGIWSWTWLEGIPMLVVLGGACVSKWRKPVVLLGAVSTEDGRRQFPLSGVLWLASICVISTFTFWVFSRLDLVHLWHRRYLVAMLPMFAVLVGAATGWLEDVKGKTPCFGSFSGCLIAAMLLGGLTWSQGVMPVLFQRPSELAYRGEDWRGAISELNRRTKQRHEKNPRLYVDQGLVELPKSNDPYFYFVVQGPYRIASDLSALAIDSRQLSKMIHSKATKERAGKRIMILLRRSSAAVDRLSLPEPSKTDSFGGVSLLEFSLPDEALEADPA